VLALSVPLEERRLLQDASVLGKAFSKQALAAVSGAEHHEIESILAGLVRKELLSMQSDPRSPERGQYGFLQDLLRRVAYETLAKRERKTRHLAAAAHHEGAASEQEVVEVLAPTTWRAYRAAPEGDDAPGSSKPSRSPKPSGRRIPPRGFPPGSER
jgi:hypothetical protein